MRTTTCCFSIVIADKRRDDAIGLAGTYDKRHQFEEPYEGKLSSTVLKPSGGGDSVA